MQHHKYSLSEIEAMMPWEREIYVGMLVDFLEAQRQQKELDDNQHKAQRLTGYGG
jgi:hypothetical protein